jgi:hypothetical protein
MIRGLKKWVRLPTVWIEEKGLRSVSWSDHGADQLAALMLLTVIGHRADQVTGVAQATYDQLADETYLSRAKVAAGLGVLSKRQLIEREPEGRSTFRLVKFDPNRGWAKLPASGMYQSGAIFAFADFKLRQQAELNAMKLFLLFVSRRGRDTNMANISYDVIEQYSGVPRPRIRTALSILTVTGLVHVDRMPSEMSEYGISNGYRIAHLDSYIHMGTTGRGMLDIDKEF